MISMKSLERLRLSSSSKAKANYIHFGWVDNIDSYHNVVKKSPYSVYGIINFLKDPYKECILELEWLEMFYLAKELAYIWKSMLFIVI